MNNNFSMLCLILLMFLRTAHTELAAELFSGEARTSNMQDEHAPIIKSISIEPLHDVHEENMRSSTHITGTDSKQQIGLVYKHSQYVDETSGIEQNPLKRLLKSRNAEAGVLSPCQALNSQVQQCYIATYKNSPAGGSFLDFISGLGAKVVKKYNKYINGVHFCIENASLLEKIREHHLLACIEKDSVYTVAHSQSNVPRHMRLMQYYGNIVFNNHVYDNIFLRYFPPMFLYRMLFNYYKYDFVGAGVDIYLVDTAVDTSVPEIRGRAYNLYPHAPVCNTHGTNMAVLVAGSTMGFAKRSNIYVVNVLDCDGESSSQSCFHVWRGSRSRAPGDLFCCSACQGRGQKY